MHAWTAKKLGDYTATMEGRLTLNPLSHIDPIGFLMMIIARFGWMRPIPVNEYNFKNPAADMALTAAAGPFSNLVLAIIAAIILRFFPLDFGAIGGFLSGEAIGFGDSINVYIGLFLLIFLQVNVILMIFNLLPIPPLDGYRIVRAFLPGKLRYYWEQLEQYYLIILIALFLPFSPLNALLGSFISNGIRIIMNLLFIGGA